MDKNFKIPYKIQPVLLVLSSYFIVAFTSYITWFGYLTSAFGFALFWKSLSYFEKKKNRFLVSSIWFALVHGVGIFWMTSIKYQGWGLIIVYLLLLAVVGLQFGALSLCIHFKKSFSFLRVLTIASLWVFCEWSRLFIFSGYTWNPVGLALASDMFSVQMVSLFGVFGLSFWVILVNGAAFLAFFVHGSKRFLITWASLFLVPFIYGIIQTTMLTDPIHKSEKYSILLIHTNHPPENLLAKEEFTSEINSRWKKVIEEIQKASLKKIDLMVLPEAAFPFGSRYCYYPTSIFQSNWAHLFNEELDLKEKKEDLYLSNGLMAQNIANYLNANLIVGLEDYDMNLEQSYNAAFLFEPQKNHPRRYEKQILVPIAEYFPFSWCRDFAQTYGIENAFTKGNESKVFLGKKANIGISICYEETYGNLMRLFRKNGANLLVNISNDVWFPKSSLAKEHFILGRLRAIENGTPLVRSCNAGVTVALDSLGRCVAKIDEKDQNMLSSLSVDLPSYQFNTLYTFCGDWLILSLSIIGLSLSLLERQKCRQQGRRFGYQKQVENNRKYKR